MKGAHKAPEMLALNPMGKVPILVDDQTIVTEGAAIALYLADRYAPGRLAPVLDDPARGAYLRWALFAPSVVEPGAMAKANGWTFKVSAAGFGAYEDMLTAIAHAIGAGPWLLGERFTMADVVFGGTLRFMLLFKMIEPQPAFTAYVARLDERPAYQRSLARNAAVIAEHGLAQ
jgi:glutathione S-transferase